ncbi:MAG TPA: HlyD family efflux transporter periplasmic adaptor subunit [Polyangiaceae bacterium]|nr:HlyD family efflux transporter periplasmic adaptor subunit [Polyangiaceae bacterium]
MTRVKMRRTLWAGIGALLLVLAGWLLRPEPLMVEAAPVTRGLLRATVTGEGRTRVKALYTVTAPVDGELERITLDPGAALATDTVVARIRPAASRPLDARSRAEAAAAVVAAREAVSRAEAAEREASVAVEHADSKLARSQKLAQTDAVPQAELEHAGHEMLMAKATLESGQAAVREARADLARATAVITPTSGARGAAFEVKSPATGKVLRVLHESAGPIAAGTPLLEIGDVSALEINSDLLSSDAATVRPGATATISGWGGQPFSARVRRVDPAGFTKVSALGLEEQRARVVLELTDPPPRGLGHDYRVDVAIVVWEGKDVLRIPTTALFRVGKDWATFAIRDGFARLTKVETGPSDASLTVVKSALAPGENVIPQPSDAIKEGMRVRVLRELTP